LAGVCDTPHGSTCQRVASADFFSALPANYENSRDGLVNTPQRPTSRRSSCYQEWPSSHIRHPLPTSWHVSSCMHAGYSCPRGLSPSETAGICFCDPTLQLSQTHSQPASQSRIVFDASPAPDLSNTARPPESLRDAIMGRRDPLRMGVMCLSMGWRYTARLIESFSVEAASGGTRHQAVASGDCFLCFCLMQTDEMR
jgi:hypothetical protein